MFKTSFISPLLEDPFGLLTCCSSSNHRYSLEIYFISSPAKNLTAFSLQPDWLLIFRFLPNLFFLAPIILQIIQAVYLMVFLAFPEIFWGHYSQPLLVLVFSVLLGLLIILDFHLFSLPYSHPSRLSNLSLPY